jgi:hypothetical protein
MTEKEIHYELVDDGGSNAMYLPIVMPVGTFFHHEYGTYKVESHISTGSSNGNNHLIIMCERTSKNTHKELK